MTTLKTIQKIDSNFLLIQPCRWCFLLYIETIYLYIHCCHTTYIFLLALPPEMFSIIEHFHEQRLCHELPKFVTNIYLGNRLNCFTVKRPDAVNQYGNQMATYFRPYKTIKTCTWKSLGQTIPQTHVNDHLLDICSNKSIPSFSGTSSTTLKQSQSLTFFRPTNHVLSP